MSTLEKVVGWVYMTTALVLLVLLVLLTLRLYQHPFHLGCPKSVHQDSGATLL